MLGPHATADVSSLSGMAGNRSNGMSATKVGGGAWFVVVACRAEVGFFDGRLSPNKRHDWTGHMLESAGMDAGTLNWRLTPFLGRAMSSHHRDVSASADGLAVHKTCLRSSYLSWKKVYWGPAPTMNTMSRRGPEKGGEGALLLALCERVVSL